MNQKEYLNTLKDYFKPSLRLFGIEGTPIHLDDSARLHRGKKIIKWHDDNNILKIDWPGNSPDLNPIENL